MTLLYIFLYYFFYYSNHEPVHIFKIYFHLLFLSKQPSYLQQFVAVANYVPVDDVEMALREGDRVEILRTGSTGWWLAHHMTTNQEGWVPSTFLDPIPNTGSRSLASVSSIGEYICSVHYSHTRAQKFQIIKKL